MKSYIKYTVLMLGFALVIPVLGFFWGDKLMMGAAQRSLETGDISEAMNYYDRMEKIFPKSSKIPESKLYKAGIFLQRDSQPGSRVFRFTDGNTYRNYDLDYPLQQALYTLEQIDASSPAWVKAYVPWLKARTFYELGLMDRALDLLREVAFNTPEASWPLTTWVRIQIDRGKSLEAIAAVDRFFESIGSSSMGMKADLWELKGDAYLALGRLDEALRAYQEARTLAPKQFAWLTGQRFIKILRPNLAKEREDFRCHCFSRSVNG